ncbi:TPA: phage tail protein [Burkholderia vietnamiensis]|nr:phage tail protein [Burkholderia vietnamiensis]
MSVTAASASATLTADEIVVETALGGLRYCLANFNKTINLATTGAGGMDTGSAPASGYVALYAIYNPTTQTAALLATNATSAVAPNVYGGANMPAGYTASALASVWPTNGSGQFVAALQRDRHIAIATTNVLTTTTQQSSLTSLSLAGAIPKNAVSVDGIYTIAISGSGASQLAMAVCGTAGGVGSQTFVANMTWAAGQGYAGSFRNLAILIAQTLYYTATLSSGTASNIQISMTGYDF